VYTGTYSQAMNKNLINNNGHKHQIKYLTAIQKQKRKKDQKSSKQTKIQDSTLFYSVKPMQLWCQTKRVVGLIHLIDELCTNNIACRTILSKCMKMKLDAKNKIMNNLKVVVGQKRKAEQMKSSDRSTSTSSSTSGTNGSSNSGETKSESTSDDIDKTSHLSTVLRHLLDRDVYLPKRCVIGLHTLYTHLLTSPMFKTHFGDVYVDRYSAHCWNFCMGEGTDKENVHHLSVQILTTPSLAMSMMNTRHLAAQLIAGVGDFIIQRSFHCSNGDSRTNSY
jgi:hypothetical protein